MHSALFLALLLCTEAVLVVPDGLLSSDDAFDTLKTAIANNSTEIKLEKKRRRLQKIRVVGRDPAGGLLPLGRCVGDCDSDSDCADDLICFQRTRFTAVPGCSGGSIDGSLSDYCVRRTNSETTNDRSPTAIERNEATNSGGIPSLRKIGNNVFHSSTYPLGNCEGDCDDNKDCNGVLVCQQRGRYQPVFGCQGGINDSSQQDYCIHPDAVLPSNELPDFPYTSSPFRLKLYWEESYRWQDEKRERKWCMMYNYRGYECWHGLRTGPCDQDALYVSKCSNDARQEFTFMHLSGGTEVLIKLGKGSNSCFERKGRSIGLRRCDPNSPLQRWFAPNGNLQGYRFELSQLSYQGQCISQAHHPKEGEIVELHSCKRSRDPDHQSSFWNVY